MSTKTEALSELAKQVRRTAARQKLEKAEQALAAGQRSVTDAYNELTRMSERIAKGEVDADDKFAAATLRKAADTAIRRLPDLRQAVAQAMADLQHCE